ncbi:MAG: ferredoxin [Bacillota bacterium]
MHVKVIEDLCVSCGQCISIAPEVFEWGDNEIAVAKVPDVPKEQEVLAHEAVEGCPTAAIKEE